VEKIYHHIEKLLGRNEYVIVPGLGGFVLQQQSATIVDNKLIAPRKIIAFNALMHHADGLLVIEIARTERISYRLAQEFLQAETDLFKKQLQTNGSFDFGNFGTFHITDDALISFEPNTEAAFIPSNFGLSDLQLSENIRKNHQLIPVPKKQYSAKNFMRYAAVFALLISMMFVSEYHSNRNKTQSASLVNLDRFTSAAKAQLQPDSIAVTDSTQLRAENAAIISNSEAYHVIVASMPTQQSAEDYCNILSELNYASAKVLEPAKTYRVAIQSFANKEEAIRFMENLRTTDERFSTAWVLCKK